MVVPESIGTALDALAPVVRSCFVIAYGWIVTTLGWLALGALLVAVPLRVRRARTSGTLAPLVVSVAACSVAAALPEARPICALVVPCMAVYAFAPLSWPVARGIIAWGGVAVVGAAVLIVVENHVHPWEDWSAPSAVLHVRATGGAQLVEPVQADVYGGAVARPEVVSTCTPSRARLLAGRSTTDLLTIGGPVDYVLPVRAADGTTTARRITLRDGEHHLVDVDGTGRVTLRRGRVHALGFLSFDAEAEVLP